MYVRTHDREGVAVTVIGGDVDEDADLLVDEVHAQLTAHLAALVLDLREVTFLGSSGLSALVDSHRQAVAAGTKLLLVADQRTVLRALAVTDLDQVFELHPDLDSALAAAR
ncbi:hypothetical protein ADL03_16735 [Nocardia sp. NRRL S-836]|nr:hypothetical protein ADL03_16735 [Nocardia sp. NRRL S-836]